MDTGVDGVAESVVVGVVSRKINGVVSICFEECLSGWLLQVEAWSASCVATPREATLPGWTAARRLTLPRRRSRLALVISGVSRWLSTTVMVTVLGLLCAPLLLLLLLLFACLLCLFACLLCLSAYLLVLFACLLCLSACLLCLSAYLLACLLACLLRLMFYLVACGSIFVEVYFRFFPGQCFNVSSTT